MKNAVATILDSDLTRQDIQALSSADAIAAFFARLGYNTDARTAQTAGNLGITAESTIRPIKKIELIADQEGLLQVYLFELQSVTIALTRALARAFPNRENDEGQVLPCIVVMKEATSSQRAQYLDRLPFARPDQKTAASLLDIATRGIKSAYASVQAELNETVNRLCRLTEEELGIIGGVEA